MPQLLNGQLCLLHEWLSEVKVEAGTQTSQPGPGRMQGETLRSSRLRRETNTHKHSGKFLPLFHSLICNLPICTKYTHIHNTQQYIEKPSVVGIYQQMSLILPSPQSLPQFQSNKGGLCFLLYCTKLTFLIVKILATSDSSTPNLFQRK